MKRKTLFMFSELLKLFEVFSVSIDSRNVKLNEEDFVAASVRISIQMPSNGIYFRRNVYCIAINFNIINVDVCLTYKMNFTFTVKYYFNTTFYKKQEYIPCHDNHIHLDCTLEMKCAICNVQCACPFGRE